MKNSFIALFFVLIAAFAFGQKKEVTYQLSSHILDVSKGMPAPGVTIKLEKFNEVKKTWTLVEEKVTDKNGRVPNFLPIYSLFLFFFKTFAIFKLKAP